MEESSRRAGREREKRGKEESGTRFNTRASQQLVLHQMVLHTASYRVTDA